MPPPGMGGPPPGMMPPGMPPGMMPPGGPQDLGALLALLRGGDPNLGPGLAELLQMEDMNEGGGQDNPLLAALGGMPGGGMPPGGGGQPAFGGPGY